MDIREQISKRQQANLEIADILKGSDLDIRYGIACEFRQLAERFPDQRAGQIITNYIVPEYRTEPTNKSRDILNKLFPGDPDPFFEESVVTLNRIKAQLA